MSIAALQLFVVKMLSLPAVLRFAVPVHSNCLGVVLLCSSMGSNFKAVWFFNVDPSTPIFKIIWYLSTAHLLQPVFGDSECRKFTRIKIVKQNGLGLGDSQGLVGQAVQLSVF